MAGQPGVTMVDRDGYGAAYSAAVGDDSWLTYLLVAILVACVAVGVIKRPVAQPSDAPTVPGQSTAAPVELTT